MTSLTALPLTADAFAPFGDVIEPTGKPNKYINQGLCGRFHDKANVDTTDGRTGISLFQSEIFSLPFDVQMVERHPEGSQCFVCMSDAPFLVVTAEGTDAKPGKIHAFITQPGQAVNIHRGIWHGVLTPLGGNGLFAVIDRIGDGPNLEEYWYDTPIRVVTST